MEESVAEGDYFLKYKVEVVDRDKNRDAYKRRLEGKK